MIPIILPIPGTSLPDRVIHFMEMFERLMGLIGNKLGVPDKIPLSQRVRELLDVNQYEMAVIQYRKETGAGLESAFYAVRIDGKLDAEARFKRICEELDRRIPDSKELSPPPDRLGAVDGRVTGTLSRSDTYE